VAPPLCLACDDGANCRTARELPVTPVLLIGLELAQYRRDANAGLIQRPPSQIVWAL